MPQFIIKLIFVLLTSCVVCIPPANAVKIVRLELEYGSDTIIATGGFDIPKINKTLDLELYENVTPITVANFLNYVNSNRYDLTFFNRSVADFVLQTGGANNISSDPDNEGIGLDTFGVVEKFPSILNEPGLSNIRGTIAMARVSGQVDSADSEWFINLNDNLSLDTTDEGFTVFGSIVDDGMETADEIAGLPILDISFLFGALFQSLPIADADPAPDPNAGPVADFVQRNLVMILSATEIKRPILRFSPTVSNFGFELTGTSTGKIIDVVLRNTGDETLDIRPINVDALDASFSIQSENCSNTSLDPVELVPASSCTVSLKFSPTTAGIFTDDLIIAYTSQVSGESYSVKYPLLAEGSLGPPSILAIDAFDVGSSEVGGFSSTKDLTIGNNGQASLQISAITGLDSSSFSQTNNCIDIFIAPSEDCAVSITYTASNFGMNTAALTIESNDPASKFFNISVTGIGESDADGVSTSIEDAAPNSGDNNFDGKIDSVQNHVVSFVGNIGGYISLLADPGNIVSEVSVIPTNQLIDLPTDVAFNNGAFKFQVDIPQPGAAIRVGLMLPPTMLPLRSYYFFGETEGNATPHWYKYESVQVLANAPISDPQGNTSVRDLITLIVRDGGPGDADKIINGRIMLDVGAPAYSQSESESGGALNILFLVFLGGVLVFVQRKQCHYT